MPQSTRPEVLQASRRAAVLALAVFLGACGGGGGDSPAANPPAPAPVPAPAPAPQAAPTRVQVTLQSDVGDSIGLGRSYAYTRANAQVSVSFSSGTVSIQVTGDEDWQGDFHVPQTGDLQVGRHDSVPRYPQASSSQASMRWFGGGRGCSTSTGWFAIDQVAQLTGGGPITSMILRFERFCDGASAALRGEVRWQVADTTQPPDLVSPPPLSLWQPVPGAVPASGNYFFASSDAGDPVGLGRTVLLTPANASLFGSGASDRFLLVATGEQVWQGVFAGREADGRIRPGYYPELVRYPFANPTRGGLGWVGDGRSCADPKGWVAVDRVEYDSPITKIQRIELRFEQRCSPGGPALRGALRWSVADAEPPAVLPAPSIPGSWRPAAGRTPAAGSYVYLQDSAGEPIGGGAEYLFTPENTVMNLSETDQALSGSSVVPGALNLQLSSQTAWTIQIRSQASGTPWQLGVQSNLPHMNFQDMTQPRFSIAGRGLGCESRSWLAVDRVVYDAGLLKELDFRFEHLCDRGVRVPLRGEVHWRADDSRSPPGPSFPAPTTFWQPGASAVPRGMNLVQFDSSRSDFVGQGWRAEYTPLSSMISVAASGPVLSVRVEGDETMSGEFSGPSGQARLQPGYYAGLKRYPFHNQARGGMDWSAEGRGCNELMGGFVIDDIRYASDGSLDSVNLRFEQHCDIPGLGASWAAVRWSRQDTTQPPGPTLAPAGLWNPPANALSATGNALYFESAPGEFVGAGQTLSLGPTDARFVRTDTPDAPAHLAQLLIEATPPGKSFAWQLGLRAMFPRTRLEPGYYGAIRGFPFKNPAKGGLVFSGDGRGCNVVEGWFMVDKVTYSGGSLTALQARFEQNCDGTGVLRGAIRWQSP